MSTFKNRTIYIYGYKKGKIYKESFEIQNIPWDREHFVLDNNMSWSEKDRIMRSIEHQFPKGFSLVDENVIWKNSNYFNMWSYVDNEDLYKEKLCVVFKGVIDSYEEKIKQMQAIIDSMAG